MTTTPIDEYIRTSERSKFMRCRQAWYWAYVDRLKPKGVSTPLHFGNLVHEALAAWYIPEKPRKLGQKAKRGVHPVKTFLEMYDQAEREYSIHTDDKWEGAQDLGEAMLTNYIDEYGTDDRYRILSPELPFHIPMKEKGKKIATYVGVVDAAAEDLHNGTVMFLEHKTAASVSIYKLDMDEQANTYHALGPTFLRKEGWLKPGQDVDHILYNFLRKGKPDGRPMNAKGQALNKDGTVSKVQPPPLLVRHIVYRDEASKKAVIDRIKRQRKEMRMVRDGVLYPEKSILDGCSGMLGCEFRDMCQLHECGADWKSYRDAMFNVWEPYEQHGITQEFKG